MPESGPLGSVRGALSNERPYRDPRPLAAVLQTQGKGVLWTCSIFPFFVPSTSAGPFLTPGRCGTGHELIPDNLVLAEHGNRCSMATSA